MHRHTPHHQILYANLELLKGSYKVEPPPTTEQRTANSQTKPSLKNTEASEEEGTGSTEEFSCNAFARTKQLFRKREPSSIMADDLTEEDIFTIEPVPRSRPHQPVPVNKFQFDSFGAQEPIPTPDQPQSNFLPSKEINVDLKGWNSQSFQINFGKSVNRELHLPDCEQIQRMDLMENNPSQTTENSIKQFCFRIDGEQKGCLSTTPIKKWSDLKKNKAKQSNKMMTEPAQLYEQHRGFLKKEMEKCLTVLEKANRQHLTPEVVSDTKGLLQSVRDKLNGVQRKLNFDEKNQSAQQSSETMRIMAPLSENRKTKRVDKSQTVSFSKNSWGKFKVYECKEQQPRIQTKPERKVVKKDIPFRF